MSAAQISSLMSTSFSVTVDGKHYSGSVSQENGQYSASASGVTGVSGSGSSETSAENALEMRLSVMA
jgi:hypothetical protein